MSTMQDVIDLARFDLNDAAKNRNPDSDMLKFANDGLALIYEKRPDLKFGNYSAAFSALGTSSAFPLGEEWKPKLANYIVARAESADDQFVIDGRVKQSYEIFWKETLGL